MTARIGPLTWRLGPRFLLPLLALVALLGAAACDDDSNAQEGNGNGQATAEATPDGDGTPEDGETETPTPSDGDGTPAAGTGGDGASFDQAMQLALEEGDIGSDAGNEEIDQFDIDVMPDGTGAPQGSGTAADGETLYMNQCAACHGQQGEGGIGPAVVAENPGEPWEPGGSKTIGEWWPYATTVYDYIRRAMPFFEPGSLSDDEVYAVTAYLLAENGIIDADMELNQDNLADVEMPARDIFNECWPDECYPDHDPYPNGNGGGGNGDSEDSDATATPAGEDSEDDDGEESETETATPAGN